MKIFLFDLDGTPLAVDGNDFMHTYFGEFTPLLSGLTVRRRVTCCPGF